MILCTQSIIVIFLNIITCLSFFYVFGNESFIFNIYLFFIQSISIIITVLITNWSCKSYNYGWLSWVIVVYSVGLAIWTIAELNNPKYVEYMRKTIHEGDTELKK